MNDDRLTLIKYRLEQAERTLHEAELLAQHSEWNGVINRLIKKIRKNEFLHYNFFQTLSYYQQLF
jgi:hypothetical protein